MHFHKPIECNKCDIDAKATQDRQQSIHTTYVRRSMLLQMSGINNNMKIKERKP